MTEISFHNVTEINIATKEFKPDTTSAFTLYTITATDSDGNGVILKIFGDKDTKLTGDTDAADPEEEPELWDYV